MLSDASWNGTDDLRYEAFGGTVYHGGNSPSALPLGFAASSGYETDSDTGLMLLGNRYYDPSVGRFITPDPAGDGDNWYEYCDNDPFDYVDPTGLKQQGGDDDGDPNGDDGSPGNPRTVDTGTSRIIGFRSPFTSYSLFGGGTTLLGAIGIPAKYTQSVAAAEKSIRNILSKDIPKHIEWARKQMLDKAEHDRIGMERRGKALDHIDELKGFRNGLRNALEKLNRAGIGNGTAAPEGAASAGEAAEAGSAALEAIEAAGIFLL